MALIDREALLEVPNVRKVTEYDEAGFRMTYLAVPLDAIEQAPSAEVISLDELRFEIKNIKNTVCHLPKKNYWMGYISALSFVEGLIEDVFVREGKKKK